MYPFAGTSVTLNSSVVFGRSAVRREILLEFFARPGGGGHVRQIARRIARAPAAVGRELERLEEAAILRSSVQGRNRTYEIDMDSPISRDVRALVQRTFGIEATIRAAVDGVAGIKEAWIFGSYASGNYGQASDIDLMVVGSPPSDELRRKIAHAERTLNRDISLVELSPYEFKRLRRVRDPFVTGVMEGPRVAIIEPKGAGPSR